ncbi:MAG TPA: 3-oxoacyl-[acyl-carrier-protein] synthase III C-terminal domain-containing protein [Thermoanaerobaculia bacterium]|jgi:3-oxoacyl-[acyl-carrier-protein] synthase-3|nr:3-oxoacyl-[acyl-carrier-protein] synthase III C-terminal domain-containing protein [Thermoanaerobaculia bacterium]
MSRPRAIRLLGTGAAIPPEELTSEQIDRRLGLAPGTVFKRTGVRRRFVETRSAAALGAEAAHRALEAAGLSLADVDCLIAASGTPDQAMPSNGALLHRAIGLSGRIPAFDIGASCLSFLVALDTAACLIDAGRYRRILIVSSDVASCGLDWSKLEASGIFGDGAAAAVVGPTGPEEGGSALLTSSFATLSEGAHTCEIPGGGSRHHPSRIEGAYLPLTLFRMDGKAVFRLAAEKLPGFLDQLLATAGLSLAEIPIVVPHQASLHALQYLRRRFGLRREQMIEIFAERGNQVGASLPSALHEAIASGRLRRGDPALLVGTGAGVQLGGMVIRY